MWVFLFNVYCYLGLLDLHIQIHCIKLKLLVGSGPTMYEAHKHTKDKKIEVTSHFKLYSLRAILS